MKPQVTCAVRRTDGGSSDARRDEKGWFFLLSCGHRCDVTKTRMARRYRFDSRSEEETPVPRSADWRACEPCRLEFVAAGKPLPPCPSCGGRGEQVNIHHVGRSTSISKVTCPACRGRTTNPQGLKTRDLREILS